MKDEDLGGWGLGGAWRCPGVPACAWGRPACALRPRLRAPACAPPPASPRLPPPRPVSPAALPSGLSAEPHVSGVVRLEEQQGGILLIASDGLWDVADPEAVAAAICQADRWAGQGGRGAGGGAGCLAAARSCCGPSGLAPAWGTHPATLWGTSSHATCALSILPCCSDKDGNVLETTSAVIGHALKNRTKDDVTGALWLGCGVRSSRGPAGGRGCSGAGEELARAGRGKAGARQLPRAKRHAALLSPPLLQRWWCVYGRHRSGSCDPPPRI